MRPSSAFRAIKCAVPLKLLKIRSRCPLRATFRAIKCAVPLKPNKWFAPVETKIALPRYQMRGPIEADAIDWPWQAIRRAFRAIKCAVPLKPTTRPPRPPA